MPDAHGAGEPPPSRVRNIAATLAVVLLVIAVWAIIEYRMQPPTPPQPVEASSQ
jgi:hypothetical protein